MTKQTLHIVRYEYPGTKNGKPVGTVYVTGPHFGGDIYSHTYKVNEAAKFKGRDEAEREIARRYWPSAKAIPAREALNL